MNYFKKIMLFSKKMQPNLVLRQLGFIIVMLFTMQSAFSQGFAVSGTVTDEDGATMPGVNVVIKGTNTGVVTDVDGKFSITVPGSGAVLQFSFIGYISQEITVGERRILTISLLEDRQQLEEIVVVGYGTQAKVNLTGSVSSISSTDLLDRPVATTSETIAGLTAGLSVVTTSGQPGATGATVRIRGTGTFSSAGTSPLVLIDGLQGSIDDVNPESIESISFLKDAASASIYGNRAANGVILITTKKGADRKVTINYSGSVGWNKATILPGYVPSWEYAMMMNEAMANDDRPHSYTDAEIQKFRDQSDPDNYPDFNHLKWLVTSGSGFQQRHNLGAQGGSGTTTYNINVGYLDQNGFTPNTWTKRYSALLTLQTKLSQSVTFSTNINAFASERYSPGGITGMVGGVARLPAIIPAKRSDGTYGYLSDANPFAWIENGQFQDDLRRNVSAIGQLKWDTPIEGLSFIGKAGLTYYTRYNKSFTPEVVFDATKTVGPASVSISTEMNQYTSFEAIATYDKKINNHSFHILVGSSAEGNTNRSLDGSRNTFPNNYLWELSSGNSATATNSSSLSEDALVSIFGRINYSFDDRYLFEANLRNDYSSRFAAGSTRSGVFPSFSAGWRISEESFWKESNLNNIFNQLKLRLSWGVLGNQNIGNYPYQQVYSTGQNAALGYPTTIAPGVRVNSFNNPSITWETTSITNAGLDFSLYKGKFSGSVEYFYKYTYNILSSVQRANIMGRSVGNSNVGAVSNKGIEIELTYNGNIGKDFRFSLRPNFTYIKNAIEKLADGATEDINNSRIVGQPIGILYGYRTEGLFVDQQEIDNAPNQIVAKTNLKPGYIRYKDISGENGTPDGQVNALYDRTVLGCQTPKYYYGLTVTAAFKGFDINVLFQGLGGHQRMIGNYMAYAFFNNGNIQRWQIENRFRMDAPDKWAEYPLLQNLSNNHPNMELSDYWIRDASYLRLKNLQIGYTLPKSFTQKMRIENVRIYASGQNLFLWSGYYKGWDPENEMVRQENTSFYPLNSTYSFGLNFIF